MRIKYFTLKFVPVTLSPQVRKDMVIVMKECKNCGALCNDDAIICDNCNHRLDLVPCYYCGALLPANSERCNNCGVLQQKYEESDEPFNGPLYVEPVFHANNHQFPENETIIQEAAPVTNNKERRKRFKLLIPILIPILLFVLLAGIFLFVRNSKNKSSEIIAITAGTGNEVTVIANNKVIASFEMVYQYYYNMKNTKIAILANYSNNEGGTLYIVDANGKKKVDSGVTQCVMSDTGNGIAYLKDSNNYTATLMLYQNHHATKICDDALEGINVGSVITISPDGKTVGYSTGEYSEPVSYLSVNGANPIMLGKNKSCLAVADNAKYVYYLDGNFSINKINLYVRYGNRDTKLVIDPNTIFLQLNRDYSQAIVSNNDRMYLLSKGETKLELPYSNISINNMRDIDSKYNYYYMTFDITDFRENVYIAIQKSHDKLIYLDTEFKLIDFTDDYSYLLSSSNNTMVYANNNRRICIVKNNDITTKRELMPYLYNFGPLLLITDSGNMYASNPEKDFYKINSFQLPEKITDSVEYAIISGNQIYLLKDVENGYGTLYTVSGKTLHRVKGADQVLFLQKTKNGIIYYQYTGNNRYRLYGTKDGKKVHFITEIEQNYDSNIIQYGH